MSDHSCAALYSAGGKAGVSVIRISGDDAFTIVKQVFVPFGGIAFDEMRPNVAYYGEVTGEGGRIDTGLCTLFAAPRSYTGENTAELSIHGSRVGVSLTLSALFKSGAKPAEAGEFTKRAFLNGKLKLTQAEAVAELIDAESEAALMLSGAKVGGKLSAAMEQITSNIQDILTSVYAYIDYPDEDLSDLSGEEMKTRLRDIMENLQRYADSYDVGRAIMSGVPAAIVGAPNTGKSSLLNRLCGEECAIVTDVAGTTRDVIRTDVKLGNITLRMSDTAGLRDTDDEVEKIGVTRSYKEMEKAEVLLALFDASKALCEEDKSFLKTLEDMTDRHVIIVLNKCDLPRVIDTSAFNSFPHVVELSAKNGKGIERLEACVKELYPCGDEELRGGLIVTGARQKASLDVALARCHAAMDALSLYTPDVACGDLERALSALYEIDGRQVTEEIVKGIFSRFCVGK